MKNNMKEFLIKRAEKINVDLKEFNLEEKVELTFDDLYQLSVVLDLPVHYLVLCNNGIFNISPRLLFLLINNDQKELIKYLITNRLLTIVDDKLYFIDQNPFRTAYTYDQTYMYNELIAYLLNNDLVEYAIKLSNNSLYLKIDSFNRSDIKMDKLFEYLFSIKEINHSFPEYIEKVYNEIDEAGKIIIEEKFIEYFKEIEELILKFQETGVSYVLTKYNFSYNTESEIEGSVEFYDFNEVYTSFSQKNREIIEKIISKYGAMADVVKLY